MVGRKIFACMAILYRWNLMELIWLMLLLDGWTQNIRMHGNIVTMKFDGIHLINVTRWFDVKYSHHGNIWLMLLDVKYLHAWQCSRKLEEQWQMLTWGVIMHCLHKSHHQCSATVALIKSLHAFAALLLLPSHTPLLTTFQSHLSLLIMPQLQYHATMAPALKLERRRLGSLVDVPTWMCSWYCWRS